MHVYLSKLDLANEALPIVSVAYGNETLPTPNVIVHKYDYEENANCRGVRRR